MKLVRDARTLKGKAIASMRIAMSAFNSFDDQGRICSVLLHLQHACEMLLTAALCQNKVKVFDKDSGKSSVRAVPLAVPSRSWFDSGRGRHDAVGGRKPRRRQHWFVYVSEDILYLQTRATITAFDAYLKRASARTWRATSRRGSCRSRRSRLVISTSAMHAELSHPAAPSTGII